MSRLPPPPSTAAAAAAPRRARSLLKLRKCVATVADDCAWQLGGASGAGAGAGGDHDGTHAGLRLSDHDGDDATVDGIAPAEAPETGMRGAGASRVHGFHGRAAAPAAETTAASPQSSGRGSGRPARLPRSAAWPVGDAPPSESGAALAESPVIAMKPPPLTWQQQYRHDVACGTPTSPRPGHGAVAASRTASRRRSPPASSSPAASRSPASHATLTPTTASTPSPASVKSRGAAGPSRTLPPAAAAAAAAPPTGVPLRSALRRPSATSLSSRTSASTVGAAAAARSPRSRPPPPAPTTETRHTHFHQLKPIPRQRAALSGSAVAAQASDHGHDAWRDAARGHSATRATDPTAAPAALGSGVSATRVAPTPRQPAPARRMAAAEARFHTLPSSRIPVSRAARTTSVAPLSCLPSVAHDAVAFLATSSDALSAQTGAFVRRKSLAASSVLRRIGSIGRLTVAQGFGHTKAAPGRGDGGDMDDGDVDDLDGVDSDGLDGVDSDVDSDGDGGDDDDDAEAYGDARGVWTSATMAPVSAQTAPSSSSSSSTAVRSATSPASLRSFRGGRDGHATAAESRDAKRSGSIALVSRLNTPTTLPGSPRTSQGVLSQASHVSQTSHASTLASQTPPAAPPPPHVHRHAHAARAHASALQNGYAALRLQSAAYPASPASATTSATVIASQSHPRSPAQTLPSPRQASLSSSSATPVKAVSHEPPAAGEPGADVLALPQRPDVTLYYYRELLTPYEQTEILQFPEVWFAGAADVIKIGSASRPSGLDEAAVHNVVPPPEDGSREVGNHGYDDARGDYLLTRHDHIGYRYEILKLLGRGSFGQVIKCYDHKRRMPVAVKLIRNKKRFEAQGKIEVKVLARLRDEIARYENDTSAGVLQDGARATIRLVDHFYFRGHLCIAFELLGLNLYEYLKNAKFFGFHVGMLRHMARQMLDSLALLAHCKIIHCDLKPENILLEDVAAITPSPTVLNRRDAQRVFTEITPPPDFTSSLRLKIIDFGSSCFEHEKVYTYVQSRFYRSPEIILGIPYHMNIDMWSFGCILVELFTGHPLFPGEDEREQLAYVMQTIGLPPASMVARADRKAQFFLPSGEPRLTPNSHGKTRRPGTRPLRSILCTADAALLDLVAQCLVWDPEQRITPLDALAHPFLTGRAAAPAAATVASPSSSAASALSRTPSANKTTPRTNTALASTPAMTRGTLLRGVAATAASAAVSRGAAALQPPPAPTLPPTEPHFVRAPADAIPIAPAARGAPRPRQRHSAAPSEPWVAASLTSNASLTGSLTDDGSDMSGTTSQGSQVAWLAAAALGAMGAAEGGGMRLPASCGQDALYGGTHPVAAKALGGEAGAYPHPGSPASLNLAHL